MPKTQTPVIAYTTPRERSEAHDTAAKNFESLSNMIRRLLREEARRVANRTHTQQQRRGALKDCKK